MATNTTASFTNHTGNGTAGPFSISFSYLSEAEVDVFVGGVLKPLLHTTHLQVQLRLPLLLVMNLLMVL